MRKFLSKLGLLLSATVLVVACGSKNDDPAPVPTNQKGGIIDISRTANTKRLFNDIQDPATQSFSASIKLSSFSGKKGYKSAELIFVDRVNNVSAPYKVLDKKLTSTPIVETFTLQQVMNAFDMMQGDLVDFAFSLCVNITYYDSVKQKDTVIPGFVANVSTHAERFPQDNVSFKKDESVSVMATYEYGKQISDVSELLGDWSCVKSGDYFAESNLTIELGDNDSTIVMKGFLYNASENRERGAYAVFNLNEMNLRIPKSVFLFNGFNTQNITLAPCEAWIYGPDPDNGQAKAQIVIYTELYSTAGSFGMTYFILTKK